MARHATGDYLGAVKRRQFIGAILALTGVARAQDELGLGELLQRGRAWAEENLDERVVEALDRIDVAQVEGLLRRIQMRFQGDSVLDLAALGQTAAGLVPWLERSDATAPFAAWLKSRLDYFAVAEELRGRPPSPPPKPGRPVPPRANPPAERQRQAWRQQLEKRPPPERAPGLVKQLKPVFMAEKVPGELVWLAEVESSFDPAARSPAGAVGLFQLMPATARSFGLSLTPTDERTDPHKSAGASSRYLRHLFGRFKDWRLSLAAYNCGEGRLRRTLDARSAKTFDAVSPHLPAETQMYVPKVEATIRRREGRELRHLPAAS
ncbi:MAG: lytic transglycosylase domain-containing protein [Verrucomicrobia bacterium]|jgi:membrane-bound lytic murein transglycosylase D|nr:lytic transglycosylase domain-containing protein [Verrucomicrobiota bacterium]